MFVCGAMIIGLAGVACEGASPPAFSPGPPTMQDTAVLGNCLLDPSTAPTGDRALIDWNTTEVAIVHADGDSEAIIPPLRPGNGWAYTEPAIFPDGKAVAVGAALSLGTGALQPGLWMVGSDGDKRLLFATDNGKTVDVGDAAVSPDGRRIAFTRVSVTWLDHGHADRFEVWVVNSDGSGATKVADGRAPMWSKDGSYLSFDSQATPGPASNRSLLESRSFAPATGQNLAPCGLSATSRSYPSSTPLPGSRLVGQHLGSLFALPYSGENPLRGG